MEEYLDKHPEEIDRVFQLVENILPYLLYELYLEGKIDESRTSDLSYIDSLFRENQYDLIKNVPTRTIFDDELIKTAQEAAKLDRIPVVVILVATTIEHRTNNFLRDALEVGSGLSSDEVTKQLREKNIHKKLDLLKKFDTTCDISNELLEKTKQIFYMRNEFVHYKPKRLSFDDDYILVELTTKVHKIGVDAILSTPDELYTAFASMNSILFPDFNKANKLAKALLEYWIRGAK